MTIKPKVYHVAYSHIWLDYPVADGTYTAAQLRRAGLVVKHEDVVLRYTLTWPGGMTAPEPVAVDVAQPADKGFCHGPADH
jgi:hypothetical protein